MAFFAGHETCSHYKKKDRSKTVKKLRLKQRHNRVVEKLNVTDETQEGRDDNLMAMGAPKLP